MIPYTHNSRISSIVRTAVIAKLDTPQYQLFYKKIAAEFQTFQGGQRGMNFKAGRSKLTDTFPVCGFVAKHREDPWFATGSTKDIEIRLDLEIAIKILPSNAVSKSPKDTELVDESENYIIALAEFIYEALNEIGTLQYSIVNDEDGNPLDQPLKLYDSKAEAIDYTFLYNGALRVARIDWWGKTIRTGSSLYLQ